LRSCRACRVLGRHDPPLGTPVHHLGMRRNIWLHHFTSRQPKAFSPGIAFADYFLHSRWQECHPLCVLCVQLSAGVCMSSSKSAVPSEASGKGGRTAGKRRLADTLKQQATEAVAKATSQVRTQSEKFLSEQKAYAAEGLQKIGQSVRSSAASLQEGPLSEVGSYVEVAAKRLDQASQYLVEQDWQNLRKDAEAVARRQPVWFLGGMFLFGLAMARFVKASSVSETPNNNPAPPRPRNENGARTEHP
jgi:hypothetical protein